MFAKEPYVHYQTLNFEARTDIMILIDQLNQKGHFTMKQTCFVCQNIDCKSRGSEQIMNELSKQVAARSIDAEVTSYLCFGGCEHGPNIVVYPQKNWYAGVNPEDVPDIIDSLSGG